MIVYRALEAIPTHPPESAVTIGNFDGVHLGHRHLFERVVEVARDRGLTPSVLTFDPHPTRVLAPDRAPRLLSTPDQWFHWMENSGIEQGFVIPFDRTFSELTPEQFITNIVVERLNARAVLVGDNFRFGNRQAGDVRTLRDLGERLGFSTEVVHGISVHGRIVSSTEVRKLVQEGAVSAAWRLLGRPYGVEGQVVSGHGIGSKQTVPTLNLRTQAEVLPATGVYVTCTYDLDDTKTWPSITNVGYRPTFDGRELTIETFLLAELRERSPARIRVDFLYRIRDERKFDSPDELKRQIMLDVGRARKFHRRIDARREAPRRYDKLVG